MTVINSVGIENCCSSLYTNGLNGAKWLGRNAQVIGNFALDITKKVVACAKVLFDLLSKVAAQGFAMARIGFAQGSVYMQNLLKTNPRLGGITVGIAAVLTLITGLSCCKKTKAVPATPAQNLNPSPEGQKADKA